MSRRQMITFIDGRQGSANSSQRAASFGLCWRLMRRMTCFSAMVSSFYPASLRGVVAARPRRNLGNIDGLVSQLDVVVHPLGARGFQPVCVVAIRKIGLVVCATRFVAIKRSNRNHA